MQWKGFLLKKYIGNDVYNKNSLEMKLTIKMHWKWFYYKNSLEMILL